MAEALISVLMEQLASVVFDHTKQTVTLILNAEEDVCSFSKNLKVIQAVLEDAEKKQVTKATVRDWLQELKDVSYEMDDVLDEWNTAILRQQVEDGENSVVTKKKVCFPTSASCFCFGQVNKVVRYHKIARRIKDLNEKLNGIVAEKDKHNFLLSGIPSAGEELVQHPRTSSFPDESIIFGREEEKEFLLSNLLRESNQDEGKFLVIPIVGMGGMGKTTLTQLVYNDERVRNHFDEKVWVCVSEPFDEIEIANAISESLGGAQSSSNVLRSIKTRVGSKKLLLVLDNVWTEDKNKWDKLKLPVIFQSCTEGSTILVTTRKEGVAKMIRATFNQKEKLMMRATNNMMHLDKLNDKDSLALFNSIAFLGRKEDATNGFGAIGEEIVKKCGGLPLAVKTLGHVVWCKKTREAWRDVLNSKIWELEEVEKQVFQPLLLSYYDLVPTVKRCLLYCGIFPKDAMLDKNKLIELWMSQGYLYSKKNKEERRNGENYFESLTMGSFFQDFEKDEMGNVNKCKMHDIVHDFVQFLNKKECVTIEAAQIEGENRSMDLSGDKVRHLTLTNLPEGPLATSCYGCENIRTLTVLDSEITTISPGSILQMKCLRTLNLSRNRLIELPKEVGELIHLRYLDLSSNYELKEIPEAVCDLYNLQTLDLRHCSALEKLPKAMGKLINLKHLYVGGCGTLRYLPKGIGSLKSLRVLDCYYGFSGEGEKDEALKLGDMGDMGIMDQLQGSLEIERFGGNKDDAIEMEKAQLGNKKHLSELRVRFDRVEDEQRKVHSEMVKAIRPHENLESLSIGNCLIDTTECLYWINSLHYLREVTLSNWGFCEVLPPLGKLPSLEFLRIREMEKVIKVGVEFLATEGEQVSAVFPKLKQLSFHDMPNWEEWEGITHDSSDMITIMPRLSHLEITRCPKLRALPDFLYKITTLRTLVIKDCPILEGEFEKGVGKQWHNISHIPNLTIGSNVL